MNHILHCLKVEKRCIRTEREELADTINMIIHYGLRKDLIGKVQNLINLLQTEEDRITDKINTFEGVIESIPDATEREMARLYFIDLLSYEKIGERFFMERTTVMKRLRKHFEKLPDFAFQKH